MRADYLTYLGSSEVLFSKDLATAMLRFFGEHGLTVRFASSLSNVHPMWCSLASDWSMLVANRDGRIAAQPQPERLSHIKHAGLLGYCIFAAKPLASIEPMTDDYKRWFEEMGWEHSVKCEPKQMEVVQSYPTSFCAIAISEGLFLAYQSTRGGTPRFAGTDAPRTLHVHRNLAHFLSKGSIGAEGLYMLFKTMDLFGYQRERKVPTIGEI